MIRLSVAPTGIAPRLVEILAQSVSHYNASQILDAALCEVGVRDHELCPQHVARLTTTLRRLLPMWIPESEIDRAVERMHRVVRAQRSRVVVRQLIGRADDVHVATKAAVVHAATTGAKAAEIEAAVAVVRGVARWAEFRERVGCLEIATCRERMEIRAYFDVDDSAAFLQGTSAADSLGVEAVKQRAIRFDVACSAHGTQIEVDMRM